METLRAVAADGRELVIEALYMAQRIDTRQLEGRHRLALTPLVVEAGRDGLCILFRYGVAVFVNVDTVEQASYCAALEPLLKENFAKPISDRLSLVIDARESDHVREGIVVCQALDVHRVQVIADVLAKSVALTYYEETVAAAFDEVEPLALELERTGTSPRDESSLVKRVGSTLRTLTQTVGRVEAAEKPEVLWEHPALDPLYARLSDELELLDRQRALDRKLDVMSNATRSLLDLRLHARTLRVEWYIVILILIEIVISLYKLAS